MNGEHLINLTLVVSSLVMTAFLIVAQVSGALIAFTGTILGINISYAVAALRGER